MKIRTFGTLALAAVVSFLALSFGAVASEPPAAGDSLTSLDVSASDAPDDPKEGGEIFKKYCAKCHGDDGKGKASRIEKYEAAGEKYPDFTAKKRAAADVVKLLKKGRKNDKVKGGKMPSFGDNTAKNWLTEAQMTAVAAYVNGL